MLRISAMVLAVVMTFGVLAGTTMLKVLRDADY